MIGNSAGQDFRLYEEKVAGYRNFSNKLWNVSRYILMQEYKCCSYDAPALADQWIISRLNQVIEETTTNLENLRFSEAGTLLYEFIWHELADWYLEATKFRPNPDLLYHLLINVLKLLHPFMPFITEEVWSQLPHQNLLMIEDWPVTKKALIKSESIDRFQQLQGLVTEFRNYKKDQKIPPKEVVGIKKIIPAKIKDQKGLIEFLANVKIA